MRYELNVYGENDAILKTHATDKARYGAFEEAIKFVDEAEGKTEAQVNILAFRMLGKFVKKLFPGLTDEEIGMCEVQDIVNLAYQVSGIANPLAEATQGEEEKN